MVPSSKVLVVTSDRRAAAGFRLGFEREGLAVVTAISAEDGADQLDDLDDVGLIVARADHDPEQAAAGKALIEALLETLAESAAEHGDPPVLYVGNGVSRAEALAAGADAVLKDPAYVRDVVTVGRLLAGRRTDNRAVMDGDLDAAFGVFYLIRALAAIGVSGTLMMVRGLRRGELRFFDGEVTSAQVGSLHGQSAMHQLLLWTEARFELRDELVVRRQQIPMSTQDMLASAERFLTDLREVAGPLSPAAIYAQDSGAIGNAGSLPGEVVDVLRLFDGHRNLADALEDSPFRVLDTLRIASRAAEVGLLRRVSGTRGRVTHRALLALEEWLVGAASTDEIPRAVVPEQSGAASRGKKGKKGRLSGPVPLTASSVEVDWSALTPRSIGLDSSLLSPVVPSSMAKGEITMRPVPTRTSREEAREKLELLTDPDERDRLFLEAKAAEAKAAKAKTDEDAKAKAAADDAKAKAAADDAKAKAKADDDAKAKAKADEDAKAKAKTDEDAKAKAARAKADEEAQQRGNKGRDDHKSRAARARAEEEARRARVKAEGDARRAKAKADEDAKAKADEDTKAKAKADEDAKAKAKADEDAKAKAAKAKAEEEARRTKALSDRHAKPSHKRLNRSSGEHKLPATIPGQVATDGDAPLLLSDEVQGARTDAAKLAAAATGAAADARPGRADQRPSSSSAIRIAAVDALAEDTRADAAAVGKAATTVFSDDEEAFFKAGLQSADGTAPPAITFDDLDEGYVPQGFWDRLVGRKPTKRR